MLGEQRTGRHNFWSIMALGAGRFGWVPQEAFGIARGHQKNPEKPLWGRRELLSQTDLRPAQT